MAETHDVPVELTMVDRSKWIVHYCVFAHEGFDKAAEFVRAHIADRAVRPAPETLGGRADRWLNMAHVVSFRDPSTTEN